MDWILNMFQPDSAGYSSVAHSLLILGLIVAGGISIGSVRLFGVSLGVAGVLFTGLLFGHFGLGIDPEVLEFLREFGLVLFVYTIGIQVGPGLISSLKREGLKLNLLAFSVVLLGSLIAISIHYFADIETPATAGMFSGATTNTPSLAAAQQALHERTNSSELRGLIGMAYAVSYPFGVIGLILSLLALRFILGVDVQTERQFFIENERIKKKPLDIINLDVHNSNLDGMALKDLPLAEDTGVVISRVMHDGIVSLAQPDTILHISDVIMAVGPREELDKLRILVGVTSRYNLMEMKSDIVWRWLIVTQKHAIGHSIHDLNLRQKFGITIARIARADIELPVSPHVKLQFGDRLSAVGSLDGLEKAAEVVGNAPKELNHPMLVPMFVGIVLGVLAGSIPIYLPGLPASVKLGLAGGPLLVAILLSRIGRIGPLVWYMPISANFMLREFGIALFLACVGLKSGDRFLDTIMNGNGLTWMAWSVLITLVPPLIIGLIARLALKLNYLTICGFLTGSMTDPPALAYVTDATDSDAPSIAYATVYPLTMFLRVLIAQIIILYF